VPHTPPLPFSLLELFDGLYAGRFFYMLRFAQPGAIEAEFAVDTRAALKRVFFALSGEAPPHSARPDGPRDSPYLPLLPDPPEAELAFLPDDDLDVYASVFAETGLTGAFNRYRACAHDPLADADIVGATVDQPACFIGGELDLVRTMVPGGDAFADPGAGCGDFRGATVLAGVGHWVQQEAPEATNAALEGFLSGLS
jgi:epoxide hydrolase A/B